MFDAGPSLFTMPQYVDELFHLAGKDPRAYFQYEQLSTVTRYFWDDGTQLDAHKIPDIFAANVTKALGVPKEKTLKILRQSSKIYDATAQVFLESSLHRVRTFFSWAAIKSLFNLPRLKLWKTMHQVNQEVTNNAKLTQLFDRFATYNGSNPYKASAVLNVIPSLEHRFGAYYPKGGMYQITQALFNLCQDLGVRFHFNEQCQEILLHRGSASGIRTDQGEYVSDVVISNADVVFTYERLLKRDDLAQKFKKQERSSSGIIFYWGINKEFKELDLHNIFFSNDYEEEFNHIFDKKEAYHDPTIYINITSTRDKDHAPSGAQNWFVLINTPADAGQDWEKLVTQTRKNVIHKLSKKFGESIEDYIVCEEVLQPQILREKTLSFKGALYGASSNNVFSNFKRQPNFSKMIKKLYFVGGTVHPGGGIPLCMLSARIATENL